ncbi:hypothetical protein [Helicobacter saguini]|nr:hypothetical protein [Helicobacter saguini]
MYNVDLYYLGYLIESKVFSNLKEAKILKRKWLIEYLVGYGVA